MVIFPMNQLQVNIRNQINFEVKQRKSGIYQTPCKLNKTILNNLNESKTKQNTLSIAMIPVTLY